MNRKNPGGAGLPNAPLDLTPLLDVIFIFLFVLIISYAGKAKENKNAAEQEVRAAQEETERIRAENDNNKAVINYLKAKERAVADVRSAYEDEVVGKRVRIVTISCTYDGADDRDAAVDADTMRHITMDAAGMETAAIDFNDTNRELAFSRMELLLRRYIEGIQEGEDKADRTVIYLYTNEQKGLHSDNSRIHSVIENLEEAYNDVY